MARRWGGGGGVHSCPDLSLSLFDNMCKAQVISSLCTPGQIAKHNCELLSCLTARADKWTWRTLPGSLEMMDATSMLRLLCVDIQDATSTGKCHSVTRRYKINTALDCKTASISSHKISDV